MDDDVFDLRYRVTKEDFRAAMRAQERHSAPRLWLTRLAMILVIGAGLVAAFGWWTSGDLADAAIAALLMICAALAPVYNRWTRDRTFRRERLGESDMRFIADGKGFRASNARGENRHAWSALARVDATPGPIVLWLNAERMVIVSRSAFGDDAARRERFLSLARGKARSGGD